MEGCKGVTFDDTTILLDYNMSQLNVTSLYVLKDAPRLLLIEQVFYRNCNVTYIILEEKHPVYTRSNFCREKICSI